MPSYETRTRSRDYRAYYRRRRAARMRDAFAVALEKAAAESAPASVSARRRGARSSLTRVEFEFTIRRKADKAGYIMRKMIHRKVATRTTIRLKDDMSGYVARRRNVNKIGYMLIETATGIPVLGFRHDASLGAVAEFLTTAARKPI